MTARYIVRARNTLGTIALPGRKFGIGCVLSPARVLLMVVVAAWNCSRVSAQPPDSLHLEGSGTFFDKNVTYAYAPSCVYDPVDVKFKLYITRGVAGDYVSLKESTTYEGLAQVQWRDVFRPSFHGAFDSDETADPDVYEYDGKWYLVYTGLNVHDPQRIQSRIGIAESNDRGRTFQRLFRGEPIIEPRFGATGAKTPANSTARPYGAGQPSVCRGPDGLFYLGYYEEFTNIQGYLESWIRIIQSPSPTFPKALQQLVKEYPAYQVGGSSVTLAFNRGRNQFEMVVNLSSKQSPVWVRLVHFDRAFNPIGFTDYTASPGFQFGEGVAVVRTPGGDIEPWIRAGNRMDLNFIGATLKANGKPYPIWTTGPTCWVRFSEGQNGVLTTNSTIGDVALDGDLDGDRITDQILVNVDTMIWRWRSSSRGFWQSVQWGLSSQDVPLITKDWNFDGKDEIAVWRKSAAPQFFVLYSGSGTGATYSTVQWGLPGDKPFSGDTNRDGRGELIVWRPSDRAWYILRSGTWLNAVFSRLPLGLYPDGANLSNANVDGHTDFVDFSSSDGSTWWWPN